MGLRPRGYPPGSGVGAPSGRQKGPLHPGLPPQGALGHLLPAPEEGLPGDRPLSGDESGPRRAAAAPALLPALPARRAPAPSYRSVWPGRQSKAAAGGRCPAAGRAGPAAPPCSPPPGAPRASASCRSAGPGLPRPEGGDGGERGA